MGAHFLSRLPSGLFQGLHRNRVRKCALSISTTRNKVRGKWKGEMKMKIVIMMAGLILAVLNAMAGSWELDESRSGALGGGIGTAVLIFLVVGVISFVLALPKVKKGEMVVYKNWTDFGLSLLWIPLAGYGIVAGCGIPVASDGIGIAILVVLSLVGLFSIGWLFFGAFKYNRKMSAKLIAIGTRLFVASLAIFALAKMSEGKKLLSGEGNMSNEAAAKGVVAGLAIVGFIYAVLIKPMVGSQSED